MKVPPHATAHVFATSGPSETEHTTLVRDGHVLHVLVPKSLVFDQNKSENEVEADRVNYVIELIETLINTIDFTQTLTAFFVRRRNGDTLVPSRHGPQPSELLARSGSASSMSGKLKLLTGYMSSIEKGDGITWTSDIGPFFAATFAEEIWFGYDHYSEICAENHDGPPRFVAAQPHVGIYDRALVYDMFQELQKNNIFFTWTQFSGSNLKIADGKVRFKTRSLQSVKDVSRERDPERLARARQKHWNVLESMLRSLDKMSRYCGSNPAESMEVHDRRTARLLAYIPRLSLQHYLEQASSSNHQKDAIACP
ncbi:hypothetical protein EDD85DRAFT_600574 [Armillaria nabsnona]|nr:hypothetical protein EDD85DRAFT_600574 [Armillaria nabsnona]